MKEFLGTDTSNYTTSLAISCDGRITENLKQMLPVDSGKRGLRQSDAVFSHTVNLPKLFEKLGKHEISAVGVSVTPRDCEGSYMPCFLAGISAASAVASVNGIPLYGFSHQAGHIAAALYSCGMEELHHSEFLAFHISGGTTEILHVINSRIDLIGGTKDISAGKAIDRIGVLLGMDFPCGRQLEKAYTDKNIIPGDIKTGKASVDGLFCNLSGIENKAQKLIQDRRESEYIAAYTVSYISQTLEKLSENLVSRYPGLPIIYAGGVMSNKYISSRLSERFGGHFASPEFSCDNAAGIARLTELKYNKEI